MKKIWNYGLMIFVMGIMFLPSCTPDSSPTDPVDVRDNYVGSWTVQEGKKKLTYTVNIVANPDNSSEVYIEDFYNFGIKPYAIVTAGTITVPVQNFSNPDIRVNGIGTLSGNKINWTYYALVGGDIDTVHAVYTRK